MNLLDLKKPFEEKDIEWRIGQCGKTNNKIWANCLAYISARAIQDRLDEVFGPCGWKVSYAKLDTGILANIEVLYENEWIGKQDGAEQTEIEAFKGGLSSALKRAGSAWGIGRYLYDLEAGFAEIIEKGNGTRYGKLSDKHGGDVFYWRPPKLPHWALPSHDKQEKEEQKKPPSVHKEMSLPNRAPGASLPNTGEALKMRNDAIDPKWVNYILKTGKTKGETIKSIGIDGAMRYREWLEDKKKSNDKPLRGDALADLNALTAFQQECADANPAKVFRGNTPPPTIEYQEPKWDEEMPKFDSDEMPF